MENAYFYSSVDETKQNSKVLNYLKNYAEKQSKQIYVINSALGSNYKYDYSDALVILIPKNKILIVNYGKDIEGFEDYKSDFLDDLGHISDKYDYKNTIGRQRVWQDRIIKSVKIEEIETLEELIKISTLENREDERLSQLLISLLTGSINDIKKIAEIVHHHKGILHIDATQAIGQIPVDVNELDCDLLTFSSHKVGVPKGTGVLYKKKDIHISPIVHGGHQEHGLHAGTENLVNIYALGNQLERLSKKEYPSSATRIYLYNKICETCNKIKIDVHLNGDLVDRLPNNLSLTFKGINAETLITLLDMRDIQVSAGSACSSGTKEPSRVLKAIGLSDEEAYSTVRISLCSDTTYEECDEFVDILGQCLASLKMIY